MIIHFQSTISLKSIVSVKIRIKNISLTSNYFIRAYLTSQRAMRMYRICSHDDQKKIIIKKNTSNLLLCVFTDLYLDRIQVHKEQQ